MELVAHSVVVGSARSFHLYGMAADFKVKSFQKAIDFIKNYLEYTELGIYQTKKGVIIYLHVAYDPLDLSKETFIKIVK
jgi:hypothetical protein